MGVGVGKAKKKLFGSSLRPFICRLAQILFALKTPAPNLPVMIYPFFDEKEREEREKREKLLLLYLHIEYRTSPIRSLPISFQSDSVLGTAGNRKKKRITEVTT